MTRPTRTMMLPLLALGVFMWPMDTSFDPGALGGAPAMAQPGGGQGAGGGRGGGPGESVGRGGGMGGAVAAGRGGPPEHAGGPPSGTQGGPPAFVQDLGERIRGGLGLGRESQGPAEARGRYARALGLEDEHQNGFRQEVGRPAAVLDEAATGLMVTRQWSGLHIFDGDFATPGHRVSTMVHIAKELGYSAHVGALQGVFGTPQEHGLIELQEEIDARYELLGETDDPEEQERLQAEIDDLEAELATRAAAVKPGQGPDDGWESVDLDVNGDGVVDEQDLLALQQAAEDEDG
jgi:hypothetical protein